MSNAAPLAKRKEATKAERDMLRASRGAKHAARLAYSEHCNACRDCGLRPAPFTVFLSEWLEVARIPETAIPAGDDLHEGRPRDYTLMFEKGWDWG